MTRPGATALSLLLALATGYVHAAGQYFGKEVGPLSELHHGVRGRVYAIDSRTLYLHDFHYDGEGPAAYFYVGTSKSISAAGALRLRDERGGAGPLRRYRGEGLTLALPDGKTLRDVKWFSVWCDEFSVNFGDVSIPRELEYPKPVKVGGLRGVHGVSSDPVIVVDAQTLLVPNFSYDGEAPDAKFWVGRGDKPSPQGIRIPDEHGKEAPLRKYDRKTIVLTLPGELTVFDIGHFAVWCEAFTVNFGHVTLPRGQLSNIPPSLKMLGVSPQSRNKDLVKESPTRGHRPSPRRPLARLDATTYRPQLRPGTGPLAAVADSSPHTSLHRRADNYSPATAQLINQHDKETKQKYQEDDKSGNTDEKPQYQFQGTDADQTDQGQNYQDPIVQTQQAHNAQIQKQLQQNEKQNFEVGPQSSTYQQEKSQEIYTEHYQEPSYQPQQYLNPYYQTPVYQNPYYQPQIYNQRAYEQQAFELLNRQYQQQPLQYRLVPYNTRY